MTRVIQINIHKTIRNIKTYYEIVVITNIDHYQRCYSKVYRRYSDFMKLRNKIKTHIPFPNFPSKKLWVSKHDVEERRIVFAQYLRHIVEYIDVNKLYSEKWVKKVIDFLQNEK